MLLRSAGPRLRRALWLSGERYLPQEQAVCRKELKIPDLHRVIVKETFVQDLTLARQKLVLIETSDLSFACKFVTQLPYLG